MMAATIPSFSGNRIEQRFEQGRRTIRRHWSDAEQARQLGADHTAELVAHRLAASQGLAPEILQFDLAAQWLELEWIDAVGTDIDQLLTTPARAGLWDLVAKLRLIEPTDIPPLHVPQRIEELLARLSRFDSGAAEAWKRRWEPLRNQSKRFAPADVVKCLVHGDLNALNLLRRANNAWVCIDWEYAHAGHPLEDLAGLICSSSVLQQEWQQAQRSETQQADWWPQTSFDALGLKQYTDAVRCLGWWVDARSILDGIWLALAAHFAGNEPSA